MKYNAFEQLKSYINKSLRIKLTSRNHLYNIISMISDFIDFDVFSKKEFKQYSNINLSIVYREISTLRDFENDVIIFLSDNKDLINFFDKYGMDVSIIKTHSMNYEEIIDLLDRDSEFDIGMFESKIKEFIDLQTHELNSLMKFRQEINTQINNLKLCSFCLLEGKKNFALFKCCKCNKKLCNEHKMPGNMCRGCLDEFFNDK